MFGLIQSAVMSYNPLFEYLVIAFFHRLEGFSCLISIKVHCLNLLRLTMVLCGLLQQCQTR